MYTRPHIVIDFIRFQAHHGPGEENESRFIDQPLLPENTVVSPGTNVFLFNGDAGHEYNIVRKQATGQNLYQTGEFKGFEARNQMVLTMDLSAQTADLQGRGLSILGTHNFKDLRGGPEGSHFHIL